MFSALQDGSIVYILDKGGEGVAPSVKIGQVVSHTPPKQKFNTTTPNATLGFSTEMVVDIKASAGSDNYQFNALPVNANVATFGKTIVTDNREAMLQELDNMFNASKQALADAPYHKLVLDSKDELIGTVNPNYKKEIGRDNDISMLKEKVSSMEDDIAEILKLMRKASK